MVFVPARPEAPSPGLPPFDLSPELEVNRINTSVFIRQNPKTITLGTRRRVRNATGGHSMVADGVRPVQVFRLIMQSPAGASIEQRTENGDTERNIDFVLLGEWDAAVDIRDFWEEAGIHYEVMSLIPYNGYEVRANVAATGRRP